MRFIHEASSALESVFFVIDTQAEGHAPEIVGEFDNELYAYIEAFRLNSIEYDFAENVQEVKEPMPLRDAIAAEFQNAMRCSDRIAVTGKRISEKRAEVSAIHSELFALTMNDEGESERAATLQEQRNAIKVAITEDELYIEQLTRDHKTHREFMTALGRLAGGA